MSPFLRFTTRHNPGALTLVSAAQPAFQQGDDPVNRVEFLARSLAAGGKYVRLESKAGGLEMIVNRKPIGNHPCAWLHTNRPATTLSLP